MLVAEYVLCELVVEHTNFATARYRIAPQRLVAILVTYRTTQHISVNPCGTVGIMWAKIDDESQETFEELLMTVAHYLPTHSRC